jgi:hypothetical protein
MQQNKINTHIGELVRKYNVNMATTNLYQSVTKDGFNFHIYLDSGRPDKQYVVKEDPFGGMSSTESSRPGGQQQPQQQQAHQQQNVFNNNSWHNQQQTQFIDQQQYNQNGYHNQFQNTNNNGGYISNNGYMQQPATFNNSSGLGGLNTNFGNSGIKNNNQVFEKPKPTNQPCSDIQKKYSNLVSEYDELVKKYNDLVTKFEQPSVEEEVIHPPKLLTTIDRKIYPIEVDGVKKEVTDRANEEEVLSNINKLTKFIDQSKINDLRDYYHEPVREERNLINGTITSKWVQRLDLGLYAVRTGDSNVIHRIHEKHLYVYNENDHFPSFLKIINKSSTIRDLFLELSKYNSDNTTDKQLLIAIDKFKNVVKQLFEKVYTDFFESIPTHELSIDFLNAIHDNLVNQVNLVNTKKIDGILSKLMNYLKSGVKNIETKTSSVKGYMNEEIGLQTIALKISDEKIEYEMLNVNNGGSYYITDDTNNLYTYLKELDEILSNGDWIQLILIVGNYQYTVHKNYRKEYVVTKI